jgi:hypothetical protein
MKCLSLPSVWALGLMGCGGAFFTTASPDSGVPDDAGPFDAANAVDGAGGSSASDGAAGGSSPADATTDAPIPDADGASDVDAPDTCSPNPVTFVMVVATSGGDRYCDGAPGGCIIAADWLTLLSPSGMALTIDSTCMTDCRGCQEVACPGACAVPSEVPVAGERQTWSGTLSMPSTCGPAATACVDRSCAPTGSYVARMCGYREVASDPSTGPCTAATMTPTCVDVPFDWPVPADTVVKGTIGSK